MATATGFEKPLDLDGPELRDRGLLIQVASPIPPSELVANGTNRIAGGIEWLPWGEGGLNIEELGCALDYNKVPEDLPDFFAQQSFMVWDSVQCGTLSRISELLNDRLETYFRVYLSAAFATALEAGGSNRIGLVGDGDYPPTIVDATAVGLAQALADLEAHLASVQPNAEGIIHLTPGLLTLAAAGYLIEWRDGAWRTATGHAVIGDAGHTGQVAPEGGSAPGDGEAWIYATGDVWYAVTDDKHEPIETGEGIVALRTNKERPLMEVYGLVVFDPNLVGAALVDVAGSATGSGGGGGDASAANQTAGNALLQDLVDAGAAGMDNRSGADNENPDVNWLWGYTFRNTHGTDAAQIVIYDGNDATDPVLAYVNLVAGESIDRIYPHAKPATAGEIFIDITGGTVTGRVFTE